MFIDTIGFIALLAFFLPLISFFVIIFLDRSLPEITAIFSTSILVVCSAFSIFIFFEVWSEGPYHINFPWLTLGNINLKVGVLLEKHAVIMLAVVNIISLLVNIFSIKYLEGDPHFNRYFAFLALFVFTMTGLVISDNLLTIFMFWELVGFVSYLLIGFWHEKQSASQAGFKAFLVNKVADIAFLVAIMVLWSQYHTLQIDELASQVFSFHGTLFWVSLAGFCLFVACMGKSAQFPFQIWLPDAMEGPTPISALMHAATMVAAGVYIMVKFAYLITATNAGFIISVGCISAFLAALSAATQTDIKKILAYSTISQLGLMMAGVGMGALGATFFHLVTHAFFKAGLFLCAGSVIHAYAHFQSANSHIKFDNQDMRFMGGLGKIMPWTAVAFIFCGLSLAGLPFLSGALSKDAIISYSFNLALGSTDWYKWIPFVLEILTVGITAFYISKLLITLFGGKPGEKLGIEPNSFTLHESGSIITFPLMVLAIFTLGFNPAIEFLVNRLLNQNPSYEDHLHLVEFTVFVASILGLGLFIWVSKSKMAIPSSLDSFIKNNYHLNEMSDWAVVEPTLFISKALSKFDSYFLDGAVNLSGISQVVTANILSWSDKTIIDGAVNATAKTGRGIGNLVKNPSGGVQVYFLYTLGGLLVLVLALFYLL